MVMIDETGEIENCRGFACKFGAGVSGQVGANFGRLDLLSHQSAQLVELKCLSETIAGTIGKPCCCEKYGRLPWK